MNEGIKTYDVYFNEDAETLCNVSVEDLKEPPKNYKWSIMKRTDYVGFEFEYFVRTKGIPNKFGQYEIIALGIFPNHNKYVCHFKKDPQSTEYYFDVGYVMRLLIDIVTPLDC